MQADLIECTILMLTVVQDMYEQQKITFDEFLSYIEMKIPFLSKNIESISSEDDKSKAEKIISECASITFGYARQK